MGIDQDKKQLQQQKMMKRNEEIKNTQKTTKTHKLL
jgi:hypothetical protein